MDNRNPSSIPFKTYCPTCQGQPWIIVQEQDSSKKCGFTPVAKRCPDCWKKPVMAIDSKMAAAGESLDVAS